MISAREEFEYRREIEYLSAEKDWEEREALREMFQKPAKITNLGLKEEEEDEPIISTVRTDN